jgi:hypothetical protein
MSVYVPDECIEGLFAALAPTAVPIDPYRDSQLQAGSLGQVTAALDAALVARIEVLDDDIRKQLHLDELPPWAEDMRKQRQREDTFCQTLNGLLAVCRHAVEQRINVDVLGV